MVPRGFYPFKLKIFIRCLGSPYCQSSLFSCRRIFPASAQNYTTDAILKRTTGKIATLECSGIARTKKEAIEMAKKSVIYTYLYNGIDGLNDNKPLLGSKPSAGAAQYVGQLLGTTRYANYIRSCTIADKTNKTVAKDIQVFATIDLYTESLERDLVNNGIIGRNAAGRETVKTESTSVMVAFDFDRQESVTVPERWRRNLAD